MLRARDTVSGVDRLALGSDADLEALRALSAAHLLACPECRGEVNLRAGELRRPHFAHRRLLDCPLARETAEVLDARACLYNWLAPRYPGRVTLEHRLAGGETTPTIDCWIDVDARRRFAYFVVAKQMKPDVREALARGLRKAGAVENPVFLAHQLQVLDDPGHVLLHPTEREFMKASRYSHFPIAGAREGLTLHFLDEHAATVTTLRSLREYHPPQEFVGARVENPIAALKISPADGDFVHPGEHDAHAELRALREAEAKREAERVARRREFAVQYVPSFTPPAPRPPPMLRLVPPPADVGVGVEDWSYPEGTCVICGSRTRDWAVFHGRELGTGKCNRCL